MSYLYSKLPETGVPLLIGTGGAGDERPLFVSEAWRQSNNGVRDFESISARIDDFNGLPSQFWFEIGR